MVGDRSVGDRNVGDRGVGDNRVPVIQPSISRLSFLIHARVRKKPLPPGNKV